MAITKTGLPLADGTNYNSGDVDYLIGPDPVFFEAFNRPSKNLAYRDTVVRVKQDEIIDAINDAAGNLASLHDYLRVSLDDDGVLKGGAVTIALEDLTDVQNPLSPSTGDVITYDGAEWVATAFTLAELTDVDTAGVVDGDALVYDAGTSTWVAGTPDMDLSSLQDVDSLAPSAGDGFYYDGAKWTTGLPERELKSLEDVQTSLSPTANQILEYNDGTSQFEASSKLQDHITNVRSNEKHLTDDQKDAADGASSPSAANPFLTLSQAGMQVALDTGWFRLADIGGITGARNGVSNRGNGGGDFGTATCDFMGYDNPDFYNIHLSNWAGQLGEVVTSRPTAGGSSNYQYIVSGISQSNPENPLPSKDNFDIRAENGGVFDETIFDGSLTLDDFLNFHIQIFLRPVIDDGSGTQFIKGNYLTDFGKNVAVEGENIGSASLIVKGFWVHSVDPDVLKLGFVNDNAMFAMSYVDNWMYKTDNLAMRDGSETGGDFAAECYAGDLRVRILLPYFAP
jgi:hypothetical protein